MAVSANGWPASRSVALDNSYVPGTRVRFTPGFRRGDVATVMFYVFGRFHREVEPLHPGWCWGHYYRPITGGGPLSNHCLTGDVEVVTYDGVVPIAEIAGTDATVLVRDPLSSSDRGRWIEAPIRHFGQEPTYRVVLTRVGVKREIRCTAAHRWFTQRRSSHQGKYLVVTQEKTTSDLSPGDRLATCLPGIAGMARLAPSAYGVAHGLVFGDGTIQPSGTRSGDTTKLTLWDEKVELARWFPSPCPTSPRDRDTGAVVLEIRGLPGSYKSLPSLNESSTYLAGWLAGYFAADGHVEPSEITLSSRDREALLFVQAVAARLGIACREPRMQKQSGGYKPDDQWSVSFLRGSVPDWMILRTAHRAKLGDTRTSGRSPGWTVESIEPTRAMEDVYCATVDGYGAFTLAGWILTGNSSGTAGDGNAPRHGYGARGTFTAAQVRAIHRILDSCDGVVGWGGDWSGTQDPMHFEVVKGVAAVRALAAKIRGGAVLAAPLPRPEPPEEDDVSADDVVVGMASLLNQVATRDTATGRNVGDDLNLILDTRIRTTLHALIDEVARRSTSTGRQISDDLIALQAVLEPDGDDAA